MGLFQRKALSALYELNDEQMVRWREGDRSAWNEDANGRPLSALTIARRDPRRPAPPPNTQRGQAADPQADLEWEAEAS